MEILIDCHNWKEVTEWTYVMKNVMNVK
jgi:hypothetical protein